MNCDKVLDVLTRSSFPTGDPIDESVEVHLRACHDCRCLAEALRPAVELFHEALASPNSDLPNYQGTLPSRPPEGLRDSVDAMMDEPPRNGRQVARLRAVRSPGALGQVVISTLLSVAACGFFWMLGARGNLGAAFPSARNEVAGGLLELGPLDAAAHDRLGELGVPTGCLPGINWTASAQVECCTKCHNTALADRPRVTSITAIWSACGTCHADRVSVGGD